MPFLEVLYTVYGYLLAAKLFGTKQAENAFNYVFGTFAPTISASPVASSASNVSNTSSPYGITLFGSNETTSTIAGLSEHVTKVSIPMFAPLTSTSALPAYRHRPTTSENHLSKCNALYGSCELVVIESHGIASGYDFAGYYDRTTVIVGLTLATFLLLVALFVRSQAQHKEREQACVALLASQQAMTLEITSLEKAKQTYEDLARAANGVRVEAQKQLKTSKEALQQAEKKIENLKQANQDIEDLKDASDRDLEQAGKEAQGLKQALEEDLEQASTNREDLRHAFEEDLERSKKNIEEAKQAFHKDLEQSRKETREARQARENAVDQGKRKGKDLKQASEAIEQAVKEAREFRDAFEMASQEIEDLKHASEATEQAVKEARELKKSSDEALRQAKTKIEDLRQRIVTNQMENRDAIVEAKQTGAIELAKATSEAYQLREDLKALQQENQKLDAEIEVDIEEHDKTMEEQASIANDALKEVEDMVARNAALEQAKQIMKDSYEQQMRQKDLDHVQNMAAAKEEKMEVWNQVPEIVDEATAELKEDVKGLTLENKTLHDRVDELQRARDACRCGSSDSETLADDDEDDDDAEDDSDDDEDEDDRKDGENYEVDADSDDNLDNDSRAPPDGHATSNDAENTGDPVPEDLSGPSSGTDSTEVEAHSEERVQHDYEVGSPRNDGDDVSVFDALRATRPRINFPNMGSYETNKKTNDENVAGGPDLPPKKDKTGSKKPGRVYGDQCRKLARMVEAFDIPIRPPYYQEHAMDWAMSKPLYGSVVGTVIVNPPKAPAMAMVIPPQGLMASRWAR
ncbi:hypothetical protein LTR86_008019 [Recurvomyces mirabilis]|nr:hypothetical protein LTR86_008019 [Recurvomyces mirabilis]